MKSIKIIKRDTFDCDREFIIHSNEAGDGVFLAEVDPDFGFESFLGAYASKEDAIDRIEKIVR